jgi:hypothetical protein
MRGGLKRTSGQGRPKGVQNKITRDVKEMVLAALENAGGVDYLTKQAHKVPKAFLALVGKIIPQQLHATVNVFDGLSLEDKRTLEAALAALARDADGDTDGAAQQYH